MSAFGHGTKIALASTNLAIFIQTGTFDDAQNQSTPQQGHTHSSIVENGNTRSLDMSIAQLLNSVA